jgi:Na+-driven multidrug efflux pump
VNTRVGNELGAGNADAARLSVYTAVVVVALVQCLLVMACKLTDRGLVGLLTNNQEVEDLTLATLPILLPTFISKCLVLHTSCALSHFAWTAQAGVQAARTV